MAKYIVTLDVKLTEVKLKEHYSIEADSPEEAARLVLEQSQGDYLGEHIEDYGDPVSEEVFLVELDNILE